MSFETLRQEILDCKDCEQLFGFTPIPIVHGNSQSKIMQISQAPSQNVHLTKKPFNDATGRKLKYQWYQISDEVFYNEDNFYITSIAHCFPGKNANGGDRLPPVSCAKKWLSKEIDVVDSKLFIVIGGKAAKFLFPNIDFNELVFKGNIINGRPALILPHPSPLNVKWFKDHPSFLADRLPVIRDTVWGVLDLR